MTEKTERLTDDMIRKLSAEAGEAGDAETVSICYEALGGDTLARRYCAQVISDARGMDDSREFIRVVA